MKTRTPSQIASDLRRIGVGREIAEQLSGGAHLVGKTAKEFARDHYFALTLSGDQGASLLRLTVPEYESMVRRWLRVPVKQHEFDALVSCCYNRPVRAKEAIEAMNAGSVKTAILRVAAPRSDQPDVAEGLAARARREARLLQHADYGGLG